MVKAILLISLMLSVSACAKIQISETITSKPIGAATARLGWNESSHRAELKEFVGVDPVSTEWCAAFVNAVLEESGLPRSDQYNENPLLARGFLSWGVETDNPRTGDVVVFRRGNSSWKGHVGFYVTSTIYEGQEYYLVLGGNQDNSVNFSIYPVKKLLSVRRYPSEENEENEEKSEKDTEYSRQESNQNSRNEENSEEYESRNNNSYNDDSDDDNDDNDDFDDDEFQDRNMFIPQ